MADGNTQSVLKRKTELGRQTGPDARRPTPCKALASVIARVADDRFELPATVQDCAAQTWTLAEILERIPEDGLLAVIEGPREAQGIMAFDSTLFASLIEFQMTGRLAQTAPPNRRPTRTDAALCADFIDAILSGFEMEFEGRPETRWASGFGFSTHLSDVRPLGLMLEEVDYRTFSLTVDLAEGARTGKALLAVPFEGRGPIVTDPQIPGAARPALSPETWRTALGTAVGDGEVVVEAVLWTLRMPIAEVAGLEIGQQIELPVTCIDRTTVCAADGSTICVGRLGQSGGQRAIRVAEPEEPGLGAADDDDFGATDLGAARASGAESGAASARVATVPALPEPTREPEPAPDLGDLVDLAPEADADTTFDLADLPDLT